MEIYKVGGTRYLERGRRLEQQGRKGVSGAPTDLRLKGKNALSGRSFQW